MDEIATNLELVRARVAAAAEKSGRKAGDVQLIAVSKKQDAEKIRAAFEAGQTVFGESKVQEARAKIPLLPGALHWQFIGHLQKNKVRHALPLFEFFHSIDSLDLAQQFDRIANEEGARPRVLIEVNVAGEGSKIGFSPDKVREQMEALLGLVRLNIEGLMCIPPFAPEAEDSRPYFVMLRELRDQLEREFDLKLAELSMGMSNDYEVAIEEGATFVRVGTAIFGSR
ncbi:MAG: YggS family pyridoxal phosphate-dependent enzyme [Verrucomicrobiota bacterium]|nr:YggS family pyridoxal phosphate-dependent enzyme [Verrucomicrobiota bacterium]